MYDGPHAYFLVLVLVILYFFKKYGIASLGPRPRTKIYFVKIFKIKTIDQLSQNYLRYVAVSWTDS